MVAVFVSENVETAAVVVAARSIGIDPCASNAAEAPAVCVVTSPNRSAELFVIVPAFAVDVMLMGVMTVPLPQPETVQNLNFRVMVATEAAGVE